MTHDVIVLGAGPNGLAAAATLAAKGRKVLLLEQRDLPGGLAAAEEFHPGYRTAGLLPDCSAVPDELIADLMLEQHGLRRRGAAPSRYAPEPGGPGLLLPADPLAAETAVAARSPRDAEGLARLRGFVGRVRPLVQRLLLRPPPPLAPSGVTAAAPLVDLGLRLRQLGRDDLHEVLRVAPMAVRDWLGEHLDDELLKATLCAPTLIGTWLGPWSAGTAALLLLREARSGPGLLGGAPTLVRALLAAAQAGGAVLRLDAPVRRILVEDGVVRGVEVGGPNPAATERLEAPAVLSTLDPRQTFLRLLSLGDGPAALAHEMRSWRCRGTAAVLHLALNGPLEFAARPGDAIELASIAPSLVALERAFDAVKYRRMSEHPVMDVCVPTVSDPSLAPPGHHVVSALIGHAPYELGDGGWTDDARAALLQRSLDTLHAHAPGLRDRIVAHQLLTPADLEARYNLTGGHLHHGEQALDQLFWLRPAAACARYATPIPGLFIGGSGSHPGGGLSGVPGWLAAKAVLRGRARVQRLG